MGDKVLFILAGNGPYLNRGCEAIVRGTVHLLRGQFHDPQFLCASHFSSEEEFIQQKMSELDGSINHLSIRLMSKKRAMKSFYKPATMRYAIRYMLNNKMLGYSVYEDMLPHIAKAQAVLSVGGDNYSLDYGEPYLFTALDSMVLRERKPLFIWGASIGPFGSSPRYERHMGDHLKGVSGIFSRESETTEYLARIGVVENVHPSVDPAFLMEPDKPQGIEEEIPIDEESIGLNLSPLMARFVCNGDVELWAKKAASIIEAIAKKNERPIVLIPHVTTLSSDDHQFMKRAMAYVQGERRNIILLPPRYNAAQTKWIIGKMAAFAGARTHSTIAAISSAVPTLSFAYSMKARGINKDVFGHLDYMIEPSEMDGVIIATRMAAMLDEGKAIRNDLSHHLVTVKELADQSVSELKRSMQTS